MNHRATDASIESLVSSLIAHEQALRQLLLFHRERHTPDALPDILLQASATACRNGPRSSAMAAVGTYSTICTNFLSAATRCSSICRLMSCL